MTIKNTWKAWLILFVGLFLTYRATTYTYREVETMAKNEFADVCNEIKTKIFVGEFVKLGKESVQSH